MVRSTTGKSEQPFKEDDDDDGDDDGDVDDDGDGDEDGGVDDDGDQPWVLLLLQEPAIEEPRSHPQH